MQTCENCIQSGFQLIAFTCSTGDAILYTSGLVLGLPTKRFIIPCVASIGRLVTASWRLLANDGSGAAVTVVNTTPLTSVTMKIVNQNLRKFVLTFVTCYELSFF